MLFKVNDLSVVTNAIRPVPLLGSINFSVPENSIMTITGKNGSGKTTLIKAVTGLLDKKFFTTSGETYFRDQPLLKLTEEELLPLRRHKIKYVFQDAINAFDPLRKISYYFENITGDKSDTDELLDYFFLPSSEKLFSLYAYELSGGMAQRVGIVLALSAKPELLILDEPTSNIDSPVINLLINKLKDHISSGSNSVLLITQDNVFAREVSSQIAVLDKGSLSEFSDTDEFYSRQAAEIIYKTGPPSGFSK